MNETKERPIIFSAPMILALLAGKKFQTRRIVKPQPIIEAGASIDGQPAWTWTIPRTESYSFWAVSKSSPKTITKYCPYGQPGDRLWVKETLIRKTSAYQPGGGIAYAANGHYVMGGPTSIDTGEHPSGFRHIQGGRWTWKRPTLSSMYMPRWASRLTLEITDVRVERVQDITEADATAEGFSGNDNVGTGIGYSSNREAFAHKWDAINGKTAPWESNPWVWAITFRVLPIGGEG
jgi:hypothetical protein